jgi:hypothetical protein
MQVLKVYPIKDDDNDYTKVITRKFTVFDNHSYKNKFFYKKELIPILLEDKEIGRIIGSFCIVLDSMFNYFKTNYSFEKYIF